MTAPRVRDLPPAIWALTLARAVNRLGAFTLPFLGVVLTAELGASVTTAGRLLALFGMATIPSRLVGGALADRIGRTPTICAGLVGCAAAQLWLAASHTLGSAAVAVVVLGLFFELYEPPSQAIIADLTDAQARPLAFGLLASAMAAAGVAAGLLASWLGGINLRWLLVADAASCLLCAATVWFVVRAGIHEATGSSAVEAAGAWRDRRLLLMLAAGTGFAILYLQITMALPLTLPARGLPAAQAGILFTVSAVTIVAGQPLLRWRRLRDRSSFEAMTIGYAVLAVGLAANGLATTLPGFIVATLFWSVGDLLLLGHSWSIVSELAPERARGSYLAVFGVSWGIAAVIAPLLGTQLLAHGGPALLWMSLAGAAVLLAAVQPGLARQVRPANASGR
ncbi:MFS transporter [Lapillicoccus sp.]|uniref:MFS transporter n=1 Tax=Lapillicoccus sp. TaxID=1909287 RepID=UPI0039839885